MTGRKLQICHGSRREVEVLLLLLVTLTELEFRQASKFLVIVVLRSSDLFSLSAVNQSGGDSVRRICTE